MPSTNSIHCTAHATQKLNFDRNFVEKCSRKAKHFVPDQGCKIICIIFSMLKSRRGVTVLLDFVWSVGVTTEISTSKYIYIYIIFQWIYAIFCVYIVHLWNINIWPIERLVFFILSDYMITIAFSLGNLLSFSLHHFNVFVYVFFLHFFT